MKIALVGYGKMGKTIDAVATQRGHEVVAKIDGPVTVEILKNADVAIEFSVPAAAVSNLKTCFEAGVPAVSGTTGWLAQFEEVCQACKEARSGFIYASNFSLGVNLFFQLNEYLAKLMQPFQQYHAGIEEIHHIHKLDAPSGTAITLAEGVMAHSHYQKWTLDTADDDTLKIEAKRIGEVPGTHTVSFDAPEDRISITHEAHGREGFALGAVMAAEWLCGKTGIFTMKDVLHVKPF
ncbi:MAG: 4-hydroxy-tetrahydrodipicolinate reductase [Bacteroidetes bacterium]|nr:4-hydroxy-tetrahydrodipicolinate reductase [Bacteroidota bacterium]